MPSAKRRTTSNSGSSLKLTRKREIANRRKTSSATAPASFEQIFGEQTDPEVTRLQRQLAHVRSRLETAKASPPRPGRLYLTIHKRLLYRLARQITDIEEAIRITEESNAHEH